MQQTSLADFLAFLNKQKEADFKGNAVDRYFSEHSLDQEEFVPYIFFREDNYGRNLVSKNSFYELLVLTWLPAQRTPIHDHAGQRCWMMIQSGKLNFKNYKTPHVSPSEPCELMPKGAVEIRHGGESVYIDDGIGIHSITNSATKPAISVHLYAGLIPKCRVYNEKNRCFEWVQLFYFTQYGEQ